MTPVFTVSPPPARPAVRTGEEAARLIQTARQITSKGLPIYTRRTARIDGEVFTLYLHAATNRRTGEAWRVATYESVTISGHCRQAVITPGGDVWVLHPGAREKPKPKAVNSANKYSRHLHHCAAERKANA